jgi:hypothetical protein
VFQHQIFPPWYFSYWMMILSWYVLSFSSSLSFHSFSLTLLVGIHCVSSSNHSSSSLLVSVGFVGCVDFVYFYWTLPSFAREKQKNCQTFYEMEQNQSAFVVNAERVVFSFEKSCLLHLRFVTLLLHVFYSCFSFATQQFSSSKSLWDLTMFRFKETKSETFSSFVTVRIVSLTQHLPKERKVSLLWRGLFSFCCSSRFLSRSFSLVKQCLWRKISLCLFLLVFVTNSWHSHSTLHLSLLMRPKGSRFATRQLKESMCKLSLL